MAEYLAPGVYVEEKSFRSKSIEGVSTTTTGFVGACRYGPILREPEMLTSLSDFERVYGSGMQLVHSGDAYHNYLWHAVRAFFEEGGRRLFVARVYRPLETADAYALPAATMAEDDSLPVDGKGYVRDGHARRWLNKKTAGVGALKPGVEKLMSLEVTLSAAAEQARDKVTAAAGDELDANATASQKDRSARAAALALTSLNDQVAAIDQALADFKVLATEAKNRFANSTVDNEPLKAVRQAADPKLNAAAAAKTPADIVTAANAAADTAAATGNIAVKAAATAAAALDTTPPAGASTEVKALVTELSTLLANAGTLGAAAAALETAGKVAKTDGDKAGTGNAEYDAAITAAKTLRTAALTTQAPMADAQRTMNRARAVATSEGASIAVTGALDALASRVVSAAQALDASLDSAFAAAVPRVFAVRQAAASLAGAKAALTQVAAQLASTEVAVLADAITADTKGGVLLRARFPGLMGNAGVRFVLSFSQNLLSGSPAGNQAKGLTTGETVWIGNKSDGQGKLLLAARDPQDKDWCFSSDGTPAKSEFWLDQPQPPAAAKPRLNAGTQELRTVTLAVEVRTSGGPTYTAAGLSLQPGHRRSGVDMSLAARLALEPSNATWAREVPVVLLVEPNTVSHGLQLYETLFGADDTSVLLQRSLRLENTLLLEGGNDGQRVVAADFEGQDSDLLKSGLRALRDIEDISIVAAPGSTFGLGNGYENDGRQITNLLIGHAQAMKYRVAVLDCGNAQSNGEVLDHRFRYDSTHAALYYPWVKVQDPITREEIALPPSGFVAGIYARNDIQRAVWKAPANEVVGGAIGFERLLNHAQQEQLNPNGINCFRYFEGRGMRLWGARTISSDPEWKYVNVRRYFCYLERSIDKGTQWAVFEPNGDALWDNVRRTIGSFLFNEWQNGALLGEKPERAFFVRCDRSTMTQNDLDNGRLICEIGVAPLKPAEFVIFRIGQWTADRKS